MKTLKLFFPGHFEDAYIYNEKLLILTEKRTLLVYHLKHLLDTLESRFPDFAPVIAMMFANNNWKQDRLFKSFLKNQYIVDIIRRAFETFPQPYLEVHVADAMQTEEEIPITDTTLLDFLVYNGRLYVGATAGFYHLDIAWDGGRTHGNGTTFIKGKPIKRLDARCISTSAGFGSIHASCGHEGFFAALDEFGWMRRDTYTMPAFTKQDDARSLRTTWTDYHLINYSSYENPLFLHNHYHRLEKSLGMERERRVLTSVGEKTFPLGAFFDRIYEYDAVHQSQIQYSYNTKNTFFVHTHDGQLYSLHMSFPMESEPKMRFTKAYKGNKSRIVSAHALASGLAIETDDRVFYFDFDGRWFPLDNTEAMEIRTFPRSERYQNITAITQEDGLLLVSVFDDERVLYHHPQTIERHHEAFVSDYTIS